MSGESNVGASVEFGTGNDRSIGIVQSVVSATTADLAEAKDENGKVIVQKAYSKNVQKTIEALFVTGTTPPEAGAIVTVGGVTGIVTSAKVTRSNKDFTKISITFSKKDSASQTAYA